MQVYEATEGADQIDDSILNFTEYVLIQAKGGDDVIRIGDGSVEPGPGNDTVIGRTRWSTVVYRDAPSAVTVDLELGQAQDGWGTIDTLINVRTIQGSPHRDQFLGSSKNESFWVNEGDFVDGRGGNDELVVWQPVSEWSWNISPDAALHLTSKLTGDSITAKNIELLRFADASFYLRPPKYTEVTSVFSEQLSLPTWVSTIFKPLDANGDGLMDLVFAPGTFPPTPASAFSPSLYLQKPDGSFYQATVTGQQRSLVHPRDFAAGDFNGDGLSDIIFVGHGYDTMPFPGERSVLWLGNSQGSWIDRSDWLPDEEAFTHSVAVADVNRDGFDDVYLGNIWGTNVIPPRLLYGGEQGFAQGWLPDLAGRLALTDQGALPVGSLLQDLNGDGYVDLVVGEGQAGTMLFFGVDGTQTGRWFENEPHRLPPGAFGDGSQTVTVNIVATDVNGDGRLDLLLSQTRGLPFYESRAIQILVQDAQGQFTDETETRFVGFDQSGQWITFLQPVDLNGDGFVDILGLTQDTLADATLAWINNGHGVFFQPNPQNGFPDVVSGVTIFDQPGSLMAAHRQPNGELTITRFEHELSNHIRGDAGVDWVPVEGRISDYQLSVSSSVVRLWTRQSGNEFPKVFTDVDRLVFTDAHLALDIDGVAGQAYRIYQAAFDRVPDASGLGYWIAQMDAGASLVQVANGFVDSAEFQSLYGNRVADADYVDLLYQNVLDRQPDESGYAYWLEAMSIGLTREQVLVEFSESAENKANVADAIAGGIQYSPFMG